MFLRFLYIYINFLYIKKQNICETMTKAYVPHNVGKEQGPLNLKVEERDLWGGSKKT